ncbi:hypothetical protein [Nocardia sp. NPDC051570]|uniref:hypothetical protein n=1 Tax=Nocardia sp. NPDC051570 TaxID=3364324 RepID=UPI0037BD814B
MDHINRFDSRTTLWLIRGEYGIALLVSLGLFVWHLGSVYWPTAIGLFVYIDLIGYIPGLIAHLRAKDGEVSTVYYVLYNTMHSFITQAAVLALWTWAFGWGWALLVVPIHLCGDRSIFGNFMKPFNAPFEPKPIPAFVEFQRRLTERRAARAHTLQGSLS